MKHIFKGLNFRSVSPTTSLLRCSGTFQTGSPDVLARLTTPCSASVFQLSNFEQFKIKSQRYQPQTSPCRMCWVGEDGGGGGGVISLTDSFSHFLSLLPLNSSTILPNKPFSSSSRELREKRRALKKKRRRRPG